jgi:predicted RecB family nuclease
MRLRITNDIFSDYLNCQFKAYQKISGKKGRKTDFELMQDEFFGDYKVSTIGYLQERWKSEKIFLNSSLSRFREKTITRGINIREKTESFDVLFDGIIKETRLDFVPTIFINKENLAINDKLKLTFCGYVLGITLGKMPAFGRIIYGSDHSDVRVNLDKLISRIKPVVDSIKSFINAPDPPQAYINKHCQICEFGSDCLKTAIENDYLSLISGLSTKEIKKFHNKGIFTVNQLSYTFKPRRKRKTNKQKLNPFNPSLKALALRENKVHVFETPELQKSEIEIFLDVENLPDYNFYYLVGVLINDRGTISEHSFWADRHDQQYEIFRNLLGVLNEYDDYVIYHYGQFETIYLKRMLKKIEGSDTKYSVSILEKCCNILSFFYSNIYIPTY